jgi:hypothetical protein
MNLPQLLHQRWTDDATLNAALPASRVYTGPSVDPATPFAVITRRSARPVRSFGDGSGIDAVLIRIELFHDSYDTATTIAQAIKNALTGYAIDLTSGDRLLTVHREDESEHQDIDGTWRLTLDFHCTVYHV